MIPEALSLKELKAKCEDEELMTLSDDDDAVTLHCSLSQQVSVVDSVDTFCVLLERPSVCVC